MNLGGALATGIFALTALTVFGAFISYVIFKIRERSRRRFSAAAATGGEETLEYFVEFRPESQEDVSAHASSEAPRRGLWARVVASASLLMIAMGGLVAYVVYLNKKPSEKGPKGKEAPALSGLLKQVKSLLAERKKPGEEPVGAISRGPQHDFSRLQSRPAMLFPSAGLDLDSDGELQEKERKLIHSTTPQFVYVTSDDNGSVDGLAWLRRQARTHGFTGKMTFFNTANYLSGRKNHLGGNIDSAWQRLTDAFYIGLHGTTHAPGADTWDAHRWRREHATVLGEIRQRLRPPLNWTWDGYPWGSRAPFLMLTDAYFQALRQLEYPVIYDSSLQVLPGGEGKKPHPDLDKEVRDLPWPFTMDNPLPDEIDRPWLAKTEARAEIGPHPFWQVPVYSWYLRAQQANEAKTTTASKTAKQDGEWVPSLDVNAWRHHGCENPNGNTAIVRDLIDNLKAHYRGNRTPFHIGLHARQYTEKKACERATIGAVFAGIRNLVTDGYNIKLVSIPELILWIDQRGS